MVVIAEQLANPQYLLKNAIMFHQDHYKFQGNRKEGGHKPKPPVIQTESKGAVSVESYRR
jgi:hypothetical protein